MDADADAGDADDEDDTATPQPRTLGLREKVRQVRVGGRHGTASILSVALPSSAREQSEPTPQGPAPATTPTPQIPPQQQHPPADSSFSDLSASDKRLAEILAATMRPLMDEIRRIAPSTPTKRPLNTPQKKGPASIRKEEARAEGVRLGKDVHNNYLVRSGSCLQTFSADNLV